MRAAEQEIECLQSKICELRNTVYRLECRNKLDRASEDSLRKQLKQLQTQIVPKGETKYVEIVKEVRVIEKDLRVENEVEKQLHAARDRIDELMNEVTRGKVERAKQEDNAEAFKREIEWLKQAKTRELNEQQRMKELLGERERTILKYQEQLEFLRKNREVVVHTNHVFPDFQTRQREDRQVRIETVYVDRPVEKVVVVEVQKQITHFISAPRPCFNKIVQYPCSVQGDNQGDEEGREEERNKWVAKIEMLQRELKVETKQIEERDRQIEQYKAERKMMLEVIEAKNSELNRMERRIMHALPQVSPVSFGETQVDVQVIKRGDVTTEAAKVHTNVDAGIHAKENMKGKRKK